MHHSIIPVEDHPKLAERYRNGESLQAIANDYGVTRERIRQIVKPYNVTAEESRSKRPKVLRVQAERRAAAQDERHQGLLGCSRAVARGLNNNQAVWTPGTPARAYLDQQRTLRRVGVELAMTFPQWLTLWKESGHFEERGPSGYVMAKKNPAGGYTLDNVEIVLNSQRFKDLYQTHPAHERAAKARVTREAKAA